MTLSKSASLAALLTGLCLSHSPVQSQSGMSNVCRTPYGACYLPHAAPRGAPCWCGTPYGPVAGSVG